MLYIIWLLNEFLWKFWLIVSLSALIDGIHDLNPSRAPISCAANRKSEKKRVIFEFCNL